MGTAADIEHLTGPHRQKASGVIDDMLNSELGVAQLQRARGRDKNKTWIWPLTNL